jgi:acyl-CoA reductase-like NAD-dependent aldehyde dehydrogenase
MVEIISPIDGAVIAERRRATESEVTTALDAAKAAQPAWAQTPIEERARRCSAAVDAMLAMEPEIVPELARQMGRPVRFGGGELRGFAERARHMIDIAPRCLADHVPEPQAGFVRYVRREPLGTVFVVAPWNYPYLTAVNSIVPALMAGNTVVLKHAAQTLLVGERFERAFAEAGLPPGVFSNLVLGHEQTAAILASRRVQQVNFTGSVEAGRAIERAGAGGFLGVGLELGGKDPAYVRADADLSFAIENVADGAFFNSGQSCCGIERVYVHEDRFDAFVEGLVGVASEHQLGDPLDPATTLGPMVKGSAADLVRDQVAAACTAGGHSRVPEAAFAADVRGSAYLAPQVMVDVDHRMELMREENFGPVVGVMPVTSDEEAVRLMNDSPYGLSASLWTEDLEVAEALGRQIETGTVFLNRCDYLDPALAWTGVKDTGRGVTLSALGYETLTRPKSFHLREPGPR